MAAARLAQRTLDQRKAEEVNRSLELLKMNNAVERPVYQQVVIQGHNQAMQATCNIQRGTLILEEAPLFFINNCGNTRPVQNQANIQQAATQFPAFQNLFCPPNLQGQAPNVRRFEANNITMDSATNQCGIFTDTSRFNHSCHPNAFFEWNPNRNRIMVYAIKDIRAQQEILVSCRTLDWWETTAQRQAALQNYGFTCACPACRVGGNHFAQAKQTARTKVNTIRTRIVGRPILPNQTVASRYANLCDQKELHAILENEEMAYWSMAKVCEDLAECYDYELTRLAHNSIANHDCCRERGLEAARKKLYLDIMATGQNSNTVAATLTWMSTLSFGKGLCMAP